MYMKSTFNISENLITEAQQAAGAKTKTQAIILALTEMIQRRKSRRVMELKGSMAQAYDYKSLRRKR